MNCKGVCSRLSAFIDGEVELEVELEIRAHLDVCSRCREEERALKSLKTLLGNAGCPELDPNFERRLNEWLENPEKPCPNRNLARTATIWLAPPVLLVAVWLVVESVSVSPQPKVSKIPDYKSPVVRDQMYDLASSRPQFGAPILTAVDYAR